MLANKSITLIVVLCFVVSACDISDGGEMAGRKIIPFSHCENTFVVSGSRKVYLFEHQPHGVAFKQLAVFDDWAPLSAYLDCGNNRIIVPYGAKKRDRNNTGVAVFDLQTGVKSEYPLADKGIQGIPVKYRNGILLDTTLLQRGEVRSDFGYVPLGERQTDEFGKVYRVYTATVFFDLDRLQFTRELDIEKGYSVLDGDILTAKQRGAITEINLQAKSTQVLYETPLASEDFHANMPIYNLNTFLDGDYYMVLNRRSYNSAFLRETDLVGYDNNGIYQLIDGSMVKLANTPYDDAVYLLGIDKKLYIFTQSFKVVEFDIDSKSMIEYDFASSVGVGYRIESVGYTQSNFIIAMANQQPDISSQILLASRDFKKFSVAQDVSLRNISVTTELAVDTADTRGVMLP